jgi:hypothetical protein
MFWLLRAPRGGDRWTIGLVDYTRGGLLWASIGQQVLQQFGAEVAGYGCALG